jgi:phosphate transport system permease protein
MSQIDLTPLARPAKQPWQVRNPKNTALIIAACVLPMILAIVITLASNIDATVATILVYLPLQILASVAVGQYIYGKKGRGDAILVIFTIFFSTLVGVLLISVMFSVFVNGSRAISPQFIGQNNHYISATTSLEYGGLGHAILGTVLIVGLTTIFTIPLGILIAIYLTETRGRMRGTVRTLVQAISGLPSVVSGLFIYAFLIAPSFGPNGLSQQAGWIGSLSLFPLMLPTVARIAEEALRLVPQELRNGAYALGAPAFKAFWQVTLPAAKSGLITAALLGVARIVGETAPLILTTAPSNDTNFNPFVGQIATLPTYLYGYINQVQATSQQRAWGAALVILILVFVLFTLTRILGATKSTKAKKRK